MKVEETAVYEFTFHFLGDGTATFKVPAKTREEAEKRMRHELQSMIAQMEAGK